LRDKIIELAFECDSFSDRSKNTLNLAQWWCSVSLDFRLKFRTFEPYGILLADRKFEPAAPGRTYIRSSTGTRVVG